MAQIIAGGTKPDSGGNVEVITQTQTTTWTQLQGKPYIAVSSKGIVNGLSNIPNDGVDFGPDTTSGATAPGQYGSPYTETSGIQETYNYLKSTSTTQNAVTIRLLEGNFYLNADVNIEIGNSSSTTTLPNTCHIIGNGKRTTYVWINQVGLKGIVYSVASGASVEDTVWSDFSLDVGDGSYGTNNISSNTTGNGAESMFQYILLGQAGGQGTIMSFINMSCYTGNSSSGYGPTNGGIYIAGTINIVASNSTFAGDRIINAQGGSGSSLPLTTYQNLLFVAFYGCFVGTTIAPAMFSGYLVSFTGCNVYSSLTGIGSSGLPTSYVFYSSTVICNIQLNGTPVMNVILEDSYVFGDNSPIVNSSSAATINNLILERCVFIDFYSGRVIANNVTATGITKLTDGYAQNDLIPPMPVPATPSLSANPPVSGTTYQNTNGYTIRLKIPVTYSPTSSAAATLATGTSSSSTVTTSTKVSYPAGITTGIINTYEMVVQAGQYFELVVTNATIGTVEVQAA
jgi:hypothetical protein